MPKKKQVVEDNFKEEDFIEPIETPKDYISTGCTILDLAIANKLPGGVPCGRIIHILGDESTSKTAIGTELIGATIRKGGIGALDDIEATWDSDYGKLFGVDSSSPLFVKYRTPTIEDLYQKTLMGMVERVKIINKPSVILIDSLSAIPSSAELDKTMEDSAFGTTRAKMMSLGFRKALGEIQKTNLCVVFIDQTRDNPNVTWGNKKTTSGGKALKFYSSVELYLFKLETIKNSYKLPVGVKIGFRVEKNKVAPPFREGFIRLIFDYGFDDIGTSLEWLHEVEKAKNPNSRWAYKEHTGRGLNDLIRCVEENNLEEDLRQEVSRVWFEAYKPSERKQKVR